jgi:hypothetical protein
MALAKDLMQVGIPDQQATRVGYQQGALTSAGTTNADAAQMLKNATMLTVTGAASSGVKMPADAELGAPYLIVNGDANAKLIYPGTGNNINGLTATTGFVTLAANGTILVWRNSATQFAALIGAAGA